MTPTVESRARRRWLGLGVAALAGAGGVGFAWWQRRRAAEAELRSEAAGKFWRMSFERPDRGRLHTVSLRGKPLLLNFWATWCAPCIKEMPLLESFSRSSGWQVLGLAIDQPDPVREFLKRVPVDFPIAMAGTEGLGLSRQLGNVGGLLPYSVVFDGTGRLVERHLGAVDEALLANWQKRIR